jgi:hypothetical protein
MRGAITLVPSDRETGTVTTSPLFFEGKRFTVTALDDLFENQPKTPRNRQPISSE